MEPNSELQQPIPEVRSLRSLAVAITLPGILICLLYRVQNFLVLPMEDGIFFPKMSLGRMNTSGTFGWSRVFEFLRSISLWLVSVGLPKHQLSSRREPGDIVPTRLVEPGEAARRGGVRCPPTADHDFLASTPRLVFLALPAFFAHQASSPFEVPCLSLSNRYACAKVRQRGFGEGGIWSSS